MKVFLTLLAAAGVLLARPAEAQITGTKKVLFDTLKGETAGNADWTIDEDNSSPQRIPTPAQSTVTASTPETYWTGALSSWGIALVKRGYAVETLPSSGRITYGDASNAQDLSNYNTFIVDEPNIRFTTTEKAAILAYVKAGGGLLMIADHTKSDRNGDGYDSPAIWNDLLTTATPANPFGIAFDLANLSFENDRPTTTTVVAVLPTDSLLHGPAGNPTLMEYHNGTTMTLSTTANSSVQGVLFAPNTTNPSLKGAIVAHAHYGKGRVVALGDSSPVDDGTGAAGNNLFKGWSDEAGGDHARIMLNATIWLATPNATSAPLATRGSAVAAGYTLFPNPAAGEMYLSGSVLPRQVQAYDALGRETPVRTAPTGTGTLALTLPAAAPGLYVLRLTLPTGQTLTQRLTLE